MIELIYFVVGAVAVSLILFILFFIIYFKKRLSYASKLVAESKAESNKIKKDIEEERKDASAKIKDEIYKKKKDFELEMKRERIDIERLQSRLNLKNEELDQKEKRIDSVKTELQQKEREFIRTSDMLRVNENKLKSLYTEYITKLENVSGMTRDEAKVNLFNSLESEVHHSNEKWIQKVEEEARQEAKERSIQIIVTSMQRYTADQVAANSSSVVHLPNEEMKGRIIGKEGRNIKSLEMATGMEFIIGETPEIITISGFNPIRREIARRTLEKLIADGRINPTRIEETVAQCEKEMDEMIQEFGKEVIMQFNLQGVHSEIVNLLGKLHFRTSYTQNVLEHSKEVGVFARMIAQDLGLDGEIALRAGLFHDIGKAVTSEVEGPHALIGADIAKRCGEDPRVVNAIAAHHEETAFTSVYAPIVVIADTISASRPGARRETLTAYIKRLEKLEEIGKSFAGVKKVYALQAGREVRIIVEEDYIDDEKAMTLARDIAKKIEKEMVFPGQIKVNVIREKRSIEYAR